MELPRPEYRNVREAFDHLYPALDLTGDDYTDSAELEHARKVYEASRLSFRAKWDQSIRLHPDAVAACKRERRLKRIRWHLKLLDSEIRHASKRKKRLLKCLTTSIDENDTDHNQSKQGTSDVY